MSAVALNPTPDALAPAQTPRRLWSRFGTMPWALADQMLISVTNFATIILLARGFSQAALGEFTLVYSALLFFNSVQAGVIIQPHNILGVALRGHEYRVYTTSTGAAQLLLSAAAAALTLVAWIVALATGSVVAPLLLALAPTVVAWQAQEFVRRVLYTEGREAAAFVTDVIGYGGQLIALIIWVRLVPLTGAAAFYWIAVSSAAAAAFGLWAIRRSLAARVSRDAIRRNWHFGKWIAGGELAGHWLSAQLFVYLAAVLIGAAAAGVLRTVHTVFGPCRVLADVLCTVLPIRFSRAFATRGRRALHAQLVVAHLVAVPVLGAYCLAAAVFAKPILRLLFQDRYTGAAPVLAAYALAAFASYVTMILAAALRARQMTRQVFNRQLAASLLTLPLGWLLIRRLGVPGTALAMLATSLTMAALFWQAYRRANLTDEAASDADATAAHPLAAASPALLHRVFRLLDASGIPYCVTHGYEAFASGGAAGSDVDLLMPPAVVRRDLARLLHGHRAQLGAEIVQWCHEDTCYIVLMGPGESEGAPPAHVCLDVSTEYRLADRRFLTADEILASRRRHDAGFWVPAPATEFACCLLRRVVKGRLTDTQAARLAELHGIDPHGCAAQARRFLGRTRADALALSASTSDWSDVRVQLPQWRADLLRQAALREPTAFAWRRLRRNALRLRRHLLPRHGLNLALLGPDGAGKSTLARALRRDLGPAFFGTRSRSFPPALLNGGAEGLDNAAAVAATNERPHDVAPRSPLASAVRAVGYWWTYHVVGHPLTARADLGRGRLVLHDRHLLDALVDPRRYRYAGPMRLLNAVCRATPKPDLVIVLDAPASIIQSRKQEVPPAETTRQRDAYRSLAATLPTAHVLDAARPPATCAADVECLVIARMTDRVRRQLRLDAAPEPFDEVRRLAATALRTQGSPAGPAMTVRPLGAGDQARAYSVRPDGANGDDAELVVKLFRPDHPELAMAVAEEFASLRRLRAVLNGTDVAGWHVATPEPLLASDAPPALVMTRLHGTPLQDTLADRAFNAVLPEVAAALAAAMRRYWMTDGRIYGDFTLANVLCDADRRTLSLVDPGMPQAAYTCPAAPRRFYPASRDLAYLLFDTATSVRASLFKPVLRRQQRQLVRKLFEAVLATLPGIEARESFLHEVRACCRAHLARIETSWRRRGMRHRAVRAVATVRIGRVLASLGATRHPPRPQREPELQAISHGESRA